MDLRGTGGIGDALIPPTTTSKSGTVRERAGTTVAAFPSQMTTIFRAYLLPVRESSLFPWDSVHYSVRVT